MKKLLLLSLIVIGQLSYAQRIDVKSIKLLNGTEQGGYFHPIFSPQGTYLLTTAENYAGLNHHVIATNKIEMAYKSVPTKTLSYLKRQKYKTAYVFLRYRAIL